jgi:2-amino-4-hydroxy-6-hydroxymethyldihydropteridine diphosphokinase
VVPQAPRLQNAHVGLGSNLDNPERHVRQALQELGRLPRTQLTARSSLYRTAPVGKLDQPDFVNAVALLATALSPRELLKELLALEARHGRVRGERNGPRSLDLDVLMLGDRVIHEPGLDVPHARMHERAFVLLPLAEISPGVVIPGHGSVRELAARLGNQGVTRIDG